MSGTLHQLSYMVALPFQVAAGIPGAVAFDPGEPFIALLYLVATALLVWGAGSHRSRRLLCGQTVSGSLPTGDLS